MASTEDEVAFEFLPLIRVYKDGRVERLVGTDTVPASLDPHTGVHSKDVVVSDQNDISARLYLPKLIDPTRKLPLLIYFHGGGFCIETAFSPTYHNYLNRLVSKMDVLVVSVNYRRAPENPVPVAYDDSWAVLRWVAEHTNGGGDEEWIRKHADFERVYFSGDSAGGNIAHNMAIRLGSENLFGLKLLGVALVHPYFWGVEPVGEEKKDLDRKAGVDRLWPFVCPSATHGCDDPRINPQKDPKLADMGCEKVLVCVAEKDLLRDRNWLYYEVLGKSGWKGELEIMEAKGKDHVFHLSDPTCEDAVAMLDRLGSFMI